jgi:hypothetical protein
MVTLLSSFAFKSNLCRYTSEAAALGLGLSARGSISLSFNTRYSLQLSMVADFIVDFDKMKIVARVGASIGSCPHEGNFIEVGRCRLTGSKPMLKAPMVSALEATI